MPEGGGLQINNGYVTDCRGKMLTKIPEGISINTTELILSNNWILTIRDELRNLTNLKILRLDNNCIVTISQGAFRTQTNLEELYLQHNHFNKTLQNYVFHGLTSLQRIDLSASGLENFGGNVFHELPSIVEIDLSYNRLISLPDGAFKDLRFLNRLVIRNNELRFLGHEAFCNLSSLTYLNLASNQLSTIPEEAVCSLDNIDTVVLLNNSIMCDCNARWLYQWLISNSLSSPICVRPLQYLNIQLTKLLLDEFCVLPSPTLVISENVLISGMTLQAMCVTGGIPPPEFIWTKDEVLLVNSSSVSIVNERLTITNVTVNVSGRYHCTAFSQAGIVLSNSVRVHVIDPFSENNITSAVSTLVEVPCSTTAQLDDDTVRYVWYHNGRDLLLSPNNLILSNGSLVILNTTYDDSGLYVCEVVGSVNVSRTLNILGPPMIVEFLEPRHVDDTSLILPSDRPHIIRCRVIGNQTLIVRLLKDGLVLPTTVTQEGFSTTVTYNITSPSSGDSGVYICFGLDERAGTTVMRQINVQIQIVAKLNDTAVFERTVMVGELLSLPCESPSDDTITRTWTKDGVNISLSFAVINERGSLIRVMTSLMDSGTYLCSIQTDNGIGTIQYNVTVQGGPVIQTECGIPTRTTSVNENITIECNVSAFPSPVITWLCDGVPIASSLYNDSFWLSDGNRTLTIFPIFNTTKLLACKAENVLGSELSSTILDIQGPPFFLQRPKDVTVNVGQPATLCCNGSGHPRPTVTWRHKRNGVYIQLESTGRVVISDQYLVFVETVKSDAGEYFCELTSSVGVVQSNKVFLTVFTPPALTEGLPTQLTTRERHPITLPCSGTGDPRPAIVWFKNGVMLPVEGKHFILKDGSLRVLDPLKDEDDGKYSCIVANVVETLQHDVFLTIQRSPNVTIDPPLSFVQEGCTALFTCLNNGDLAANITWSMNGNPLVNSTNILLREAGDLIILNVTSDNAGIYTCKLINETAIGSSNNGTLIVTDGGVPIGPVSSAPSIVVSSPPVQMIVPNSLAQFTCFAQGFPLPTVSWTRDTLPLTTTGRVAISNESLIIINVIASDAGTYQCTVSNAVGQTTANFELIIIEEPSIIVRDTEISVNVNEGLTLTCESNGRPTPDISWYHNDTLIVASTDLTISTSGGTSNLTITNVSSFMTAGNYTCIANNTIGTARHSYLVTIQEVALSSAPVLTLNPLNVRIPVGSSFNITFTLTGLPLPSVTWTRDGTTLFNDSRTSIQTDVIIINDAVTSDSGIYTCIATNINSTTSHSVYVEVYEVTAIPSFIMSPIEVSVTERESVNLTCRAVGIPLPMIAWYKGQDEVTQAIINGILTIDAVFDDQSINATLTIANATLEDAGIYTCRANNSAGMNEIQFAVNINPITIRPQFVSFPTCLCPCAYNDTNIVTIGVMGDPEPSYRWFFSSSDPPLLSYQPINENKFVLFSNGSFRVTSEASSDDTGHYRVIADNGVGTAEAHFRLCFNNPTDLSITVFSRSSVTLGCHDNANTTNDYAWWHNGHLMVGENQPLLSMNDVQRYDSGRYTCTADEKMSSLTFLIVQDRKEPPYFASLLNDTEVMINDSLSLYCDVMGPSYPVEIVWFHNSQLINSTRSNGILISSGDRKNLTITQISLADSGLYTCMAVNLYGNSSTFAFIQVHSVPPNETLYMTVDSFRQLTCVDGAVEGTLGRIQWFFNGLLIDEGRLVNNVLTWGNNLWILEGANVSNEGDYTCHTDGLVHNVYYIRIIVPPTIRLTQTKVFPLNGTDVSLHCVVDGKPMPRIDWKYQSNDITISNKYSIFQNGTLVVHSVGEYDNGLYTCCANNTFGHNTHQSLSVNVQLY
jgi:hemicentin